MWTWLATLPILAQIILPIVILILLIIGIVMIAIYGKLGIAWGKKSIGLGGDSDKKSRTCIDCSMFHRAYSAKVNRKIIKIESNIMKRKMTYTEQKLLDLKNLLYNKFKPSIPDDGVKDLNLRIKYVLNHSIKSEIRRSIKENGFHEIDGIRFEEYVTNRINTIRDMIEDDLMLYYENELINEVLDDINNEFKKIINTIYENAKIIEIGENIKINKLEKEYDDSIDEFIGLDKVKE